MNVLIISRCTKRAREESCRIIDRFAERTGDTAWQTVITLEGANTLRRLLRKSARRNTAVACHWLKKNGQMELMWIVGNLRRFNAQGRVPTHRTARAVVTNRDENQWRCAESIALLAAIAGLFHDFGKAGYCFQESLTKKGGKRFQPYRHEWISVRLFQAFVGEQTDERWLEKLETLSPADETQILSRLQKDHPHFSDSPFRTLSPLAKVVAWLILSHHRLPENLRSESRESSENCDRWLENQLNADWNALNHDDSQKAFNWSETDFHHVWTFPLGTPLQSRVWREKARQIARRAKNAAALKQWGQMDQLFTLHMARFCLMLADHFYSASDPHPGWQDPDYAVWANSDRKSGALKQRVDEHLTGVAHHALLVGRQLMRVRTSLPAIARHKGFRERAVNPLFHWQNKAWDVAAALRERSREEGFFGVNMASTGCGKTFANARIMYALADEHEGCRFTVALGLRTLTLQTGDALRNRLHLGEDDLAVMVGSGAVRQLWQQENKKSEPDQGSVSASALTDEQQYVHYDGGVQTGVLEKWLRGDGKLSALVSAPVLVATLDHLIPATDGVRGGKQLPAMLRLLTSDLVLDEPDDFDVADLHTVCRLMNWAGMLGSRVLLSSATLPPDLVQALFAAYLAGRKIWQASCGAGDRPVNICCAWFDEKRANAEQIADGRSFSRAHNAFVEQRALMLAKKERLHFGRIAPISPASSAVSEVITCAAETVHQQMLALHQAHKEIHETGKTVSLGLVRFANIAPLVAVAKALFALPSPENICIHYCVYHARHPLAVRSALEKCLDSAFTRHQPDAVWKHPDIAQAIHTRPEKHHLFVVLGTSVMEVGRDWDASWGIVEPSSMRSIIQFAGRIQRHRRQVPERENLVILSRNIRALREQSPAFSQPGFEDKNHLLDSHDLQELLPPRDYQTINAVSRILPTDGKNKLAELEHLRLRAELRSKKSKQVVAANWWRQPLTWCAWMQRRTPFRHSPQREGVFFLHMEDEESEPYFAFREENGRPKPSDKFVFQEVEPASGVVGWGNVNYQQILRDQADWLNMAIDRVGEMFAEIRVPVNEQEDAVSDWKYHPWLGVFRDLH
ncbi:type I-F CRISPR-associated helicase Cas3 [Citrobacter amalonaticus]|uniref:Type I-F CRISPR-associated helicase Cas3 n=1 Tax=Citrobacter amalonaticus TaxID=35703 RepID=A0A2S4RZ53_CITAM|nr:type I-F CRISPR-associated helicase Cas3f [Citrobacter amalonaticus]POT57950.1 type I-F CRISPR-associated helicase Cas3 [Citrobacter amalonaticus]POT76525.1 type I-F CRISPR-associated helicase Cas3 [Citrobacter amalonaticus]POU66476.1 type I-F CRISPR-associated helicase Cas3 [Citrobacter amalonaticus]POV05760.1 type I-F CRISPR-associated helicase Cas3 [Citrobacter amalonaticus]